MRMGRSAVIVTVWDRVTSCGILMVFHPRLVVSMPSGERNVVPTLSRVKFTVRPARPTDICLAVRCQNEALLADLGAGRNSRSLNRASLLMCGKTRIASQTRDLGRSSHPGNGLDQVRSVKYPSQPALTDGRGSPVGLLVPLPGAVWAAAVCVVSAGVLAGGSALCHLALPGLGDAASGRPPVAMGTQLAPLETLPRLLPHTPESLEARPGSLILEVLNRKGFIRIALKCGAHLVPVFSFGENELFEQLQNPHGSVVRRIQEGLRRTLGFSLPLFHGRGVFQYSYGIIPYRRAIYTVVGRPIPVQMSVWASAEEVDQLHGRYLEALSQLFEEHKTQYGIQQHRHLIFT
ncbi:uncharacterized protein LOC121683997 isoform X1 [Alosa sapidissima]|uniref:uncharacterized protein LOC121683997 isoform X1 n=1 Tax=Alosa sapidissima TaxID=34773 RepID=UPI001C08081D|nr:uncharacterized protein LOC121683997 isoform X1 [Alosa sapidissima]